MKKLTRDEMKKVLGGVAPVSCQCEETCEKGYKCMEASCGMQSGYQCVKTN